jgi:hypothetical protein
MAVQDKEGSTPYYITLRYTNNSAAPIILNLSDDDCAKTQIDNPSNILTGKKAIDKPKVFKDYLDMARSEESSRSNKKARKQSAWNVTSSTTSTISDAEKPNEKTTAAGITCNRHIYCQSCKKQELGTTHEIEKKNESKWQNPTVDFGGDNEAKSISSSSKIIKERKPYQRKRTTAKALMKTQRLNELLLVQTCLNNAYDEVGKIFQTFKKLLE